MRVSVLVILMLGACGPSRAVRSYAYVDSARADRSPHFANDLNHDECYLHAEVPKQPVTHRPIGAAPELLRDAVAISPELDGAGDYCEVLANTWQLVTYERGHPGRADFILPKEHNSVTTDLLLVCVEIAVLLAIKDRYGRIRAARLGLS